ncbi:adrenodoxin-like protein 2, mitochondrial isoform X2 [Solanum dulcamara]|uniref:adrenodoxin-like protein 2, mitochondrial isoform X2 n=1 Tax=Solanum dulcamara TaxID=45834 RepID=UPI0024855D84|nr:adrenodoxin-like protein 2, mitochondrial isoform X2 [Solanum dulcamara]
MVGFHVRRLSHRLTRSSLSSLLLHDSATAAHVSLLKVGSRSYNNTAAKNQIRGLFPSNCSNATSPCTPGTSYGPLPRYQIFLGLRHKEYCTTTEKEEKQTISVAFVDKDGEEKHIKVPVGMSLLEAAHENDIELEGACEGSLACSTCHVIVMDVDYYNKLEDPTDEENDMLDLAFGLTETSRLGCQVIAKPELDGIRVALPAATRNFAVDGFKPKPH